MKKKVHYISILLGIGLLIYNEVILSQNLIVSIVGLILLVWGIYLLSKGIGDKPNYDPYAIRYEDEEE